MLAMPSRTQNQRETIPTAASRTSCWFTGHGLTAQVGPDVIPLLEKDGYHVIAVQLPLTSLAEDDAVTERAIARITTAYPGPVLLVGHSYGGVVISDTPGNDPNVVGLSTLPHLPPTLVIPRCPCSER